MTSTSKYKEREVLEALEVMSDFFYEQTGDKWYQELNNSVNRKINKKWGDKGVYCE